MYLSKLPSFALCCPKTLVCFAYLLERQFYFNKVYNIDTTNKHTFFIKPHALLTPLAETIGLYKIIWQTLYAVRHSLFPLDTLDIILNTLYLHSYCFQSIQKCGQMSNDCELYVLLLIFKYKICNRIWLKAN